MKECKQSKNPRKTSIDFITAKCMGILQLPYQRPYYNGVPLGISLFNECCAAENLDCCGRAWKFYKATANSHWSQTKPLIYNI